MPQNVRVPDHVSESLNNSQKNQANAEDSTETPTEAAKSAKKPGMFSRKESKPYHFMWLVLAVCFIALIFPVVSRIIHDLSGIGSDWGFDVMRWVKNTSLNPLHKTGFRNFLRLILTLFCIGIGMYLLKEK